MFLKVSCPKCTVMVWDFDEHINLQADLDIARNSSNDLFKKILQQSMMM
jgi:hypothetical protein